MRAGIKKDVPTTVRNPQASAVCERLHQSITNTLHILLRHSTPANVANIADLVDTSIATALHAARSAIHRTLGVSPGGLVFQRDMLLDIPLLTDIQLIRDRRLVVIDENLRRAVTADAVIITISLVLNVSSYIMTQRSSNLLASMVHTQLNKYTPMAPSQPAAMLTQRNV